MISFHLFIKGFTLRCKGVTYLGFFYKLVLGKIFFLAPYILDTPLLSNHHLRWHYHLSFNTRPCLTPDGVSKRDCGCNEANVTSVYISWKTFHIRCTKTLWKITREPVVLGTMSTGAQGPASRFRGVLNNRFFANREQKFTTFKDLRKSPHHW